MKLLVLAQTPPPLHGQSVMVRTLVEGLPARGVALHHVDLRLSSDTAEIGRWSFAKIFRTLGCALRAIRARFAHDCDTLYYVPAPPAKRGALYRDWVLMLLCRPFFRRLVLHWHAAGLGAWLCTEATRFERIVTRTLLGRASLAVVLADALRSDAEFLHARQIAVVPNGIADPPRSAPSAPDVPYRFLFLSLCSEEKGLFAAASAVLAANRQNGASSDAPAFTLTVAGPFNDDATAARFQQLCREHPRVLSHAGIADEAAKARLFATTHALLFPTHYPAEGMPLVALEALAHDRPIIATHWRALPEIVTSEVGALVPSGDAAALSAALLQMRAHPPAPGVCRARFLERFTIERHLASLAAALRALD